MKIFDLNKKFTRKEKSEIIKKRARYWFENQDIEKYGKQTYKECLERSRSMMMLNKHYERFALVAKLVCEKLQIPTDSNHIKMSLNYWGWHSWYIYKNDKQILRISDHIKVGCSSILIGFTDNHYDEFGKLKQYPKGYYLWDDDSDPYFYSYKGKRDLKEDVLHFINSNETN